MPPPAAAPPGMGSPDAAAPTTGPTASAPAVTHPPGVEPGLRVEAHPPPFLADCGQPRVRA